jgi:hypothetical protein
MYPIFCNTLAAFPVLLPSEHDHPKMKKQVLNPAAFEQFRTSRGAARLACDLLPPNWTVYRRNFPR